MRPGLGSTSPQVAPSRPSPGQILRTPNLGRIPGVPAGIGDVARTRLIADKFKFGPSWPKLGQIWPGFDELQADLRRH